MDVLVQMRSNFDKPEEMVHLKKRLTGENLREESWGRHKVEDARSRG